MRLTLRTLLAYLDDTLDATEIKEIGEKVAESDAAQELVARLKQVTRRRRLTVPPATGPEGTDPNDVAEYLDNELASERVSDLEKLALESDVHLAEIAACHQILTLVLGEPALVPPKAKERMYALVRGREALPNRKAQAPKRSDPEATVDEEELNLSSGWLRWALPAAGVLLVGLLALAVYSVLPGPRPKGPAVASSGDPGKGAGAADAGAADAKDDGKVKKAGEGGTTPAGASEGGSGAGDAGTAKKDAPGGGAPGVGKVDDGAAEVRRPAPPSKERVVLANYFGAPSGLPAGLATLPEGSDKWQRFDKSGTSVYSSDPLLALPGFAGVVRTKSGVDVTLRGHLRDFTIAPVMHFLMDSAVVLHPSKEFDLDLTLLRGRIFLTSRKDKGPAKIRLRFDKEVWDLTLAGRGDEAAVDLTRAYSAVINYRAGEEPRAQCFLALLRGEADLKIDAFQTHSLEAEPPKWVRMEWDSFTRTSGPFKADQATPALRREPPSPELLPESRRESLRRMETALKNMEALFGSGKSLEVALQETLQKPDPAGRVLAVYCLTAIDAIGPVIDVLGDEDPLHVADREAAFFALQRWVGRSPAHAKRLYDEKTKTGLLIDKKYRQREAETIVQLLHPLLADELTKPETYEALARCLQHRKVAIAEMGYWHLLWLSGNVKLPQGFNAALPQEERERYAAQVQKLIESKQLPPAGPAAPEKAGG